MRRLRWALLALIVLGILAIVVRATRGPSVEAGSVLVLELSGELVEEPDPPWLLRLLGPAQRSFVSVLSELRKAERDERIAKVLLKIRDLEIGWAKAQELRSAIADLREAGRETVAYLEVESLGTNLPYFVASAADEVYVPPGSRPALVGLAAQFLFLGGLFDKLGVGLEVERVGRYKSAAETLAGREMSDAHREMAASLLDSLDAQFVAGIAESRELSEAEVRRAIELAPGDPEELEALDLVDGVKTLGDLFELYGEPPVIHANAYAGVDPASLGFEPEARFALIHGSGAVVTGSDSRSRTGEPLLAAGRVVAALEEAAEDASIDAILMRIESPGGSALASDLIWKAVRRAREKKPVIASLSDVAASGGYYVACAADEVVADGATLTGSIGVFVLRPVLNRLLDRLEVGHEGMTRGPRAEILLATRPLSDATRRWLERDVRSIYERFVERVAEGRGLERDAVDAVAQGRVWTGAQAVERGLVDTEGGLRAAVARARERLGLAPDTDVALIPYPPPKPWFEQLRDTLPQVGASWLWSAWPEELRHLAGWLEALPVRSPVLIPPFWVEVR